MIFRCSKKMEMYLYLPHQEDQNEALKAMPEGLENVTGRLSWVMDLELTADRKLARADVDEVKIALAEKGFYLQSPPNDMLKADESMLNHSSDGF